MAIVISDDVLKLRDETKNIDKVIEDISLQFSMDRDHIKEFAYFSSQFITRPELLGNFKNTILGIKKDGEHYIDKIRDMMSETVFFITIKIPLKLLVKLMACMSISITTVTNIYNVFNKEINDTKIIEGISNFLSPLTKTGKKIYTFLTELKKNGTEFIESIKRQYPGLDVEELGALLKKYLSTGNVKKKVQKLGEFIKIYAEKGKIAYYKAVHKVVDVLLMSILLLIGVCIGIASISSIVLVIVSVIGTVSLIIVFVFLVGKFSGFVEDGETEEDVVDDLKELEYDRYDLFESIIHEADDETADEEINLDEEPKDLEMPEEVDDTAEETTEEPSNEGEDSETEETDTEEEPADEESGNNEDSYDFEDTGDEDVDKERKENAISSLKEVKKSFEDNIFDFKDTDIYKENQELFDDVINEFELTNTNLSAHIRHINSKSSPEILMSVLEYKAIYAQLSVRLEEITSTIENGK